MYPFLFSTQHYEFFFFLRIIVIECLAMKLMDLLSSWEEGSLFQGETNWSRIYALNSFPDLLLLYQHPIQALVTSYTERDCMCYVCLHLAFEATLFLGREGHAMHTLGEAVGEAVVLGYSSPVPVENGWILMLGSACVLSRFSCIQLFVTQWTVDCQAPLSMGSSRQEYWSGLHCPPPGNLPDPEIKLASPKSSALAGKFFTTSTTWEALKLGRFACKSSLPHFLILDKLSSQHVSSFCIAWRILSILSIFAHCQKFTFLSLSINKYLLNTIKCYFWN